MSQTYLLLDGAQIDDLLAQLYRLEEAPQPHLLYRQTRYQALADTGPVLIRLAADSRLERHFDDHWRARGGLWLESDADEASLVEHLRSLVHALVQGETTVLLRYYDPRIMRHWLPELAEAERDRLMGPVRRIRLADADPEAAPRDIRRQGPASAARYADTPWLHLHDEQIERLNRARVEAFDQHLLAHVDQHVPDCLAGREPGTRQAWAIDCRTGAEAHGYTSADQVVRWANLCARLGTDFPQAPAHQAYRRILDTPGLSAEQRLERLTLELQRQLLADKEAPL